MHAAGAFAAPSSHPPAPRWRTPLRRGSRATRPARPAARPPAGVSSPGRASALASRGGPRTPADGAAPQPGSKASSRRLPAPRRQAAAGAAAPASAASAAAAAAAPSAAPPRPAAPWSAAAGAALAQSTAWAAQRRLRARRAAWRARVSRREGRSAAPASSHRCNKPPDARMARGPTCNPSWAWWTRTRSTSLKTCKSGPRLPWRPLR
mmetsp:Transcript_72842/g.236642  ORF Transcript_72842/g.236642 Transcript_72842/m.236642 type:complete len:208 (-) Transcript_72842:191-814(-)